MRHRFIQKGMFLLLASVALCLPAAAQTVTGNYRNALLIDVIKDLQVQSGKSFVYDSADIEGASRVTAQFTEAPLADALGKVIKRPLTYEIKGNIVVISKAAPAAGRQEPAAQGQRAADRTVTGRVLDPDGLPVVGAAVMLAGTTRGVTTDLDGNFTIRLSGANPILRFDCIGYKPESVRVADKAERLAVTMEPDSQQLEESVVTALGITRKEKSLGYSVAKVTGDDLGNTGAGNWLSGMSGKVAGLSMDQSSAGPGGSVRVTLRGEGSLSYDNNTALFVIDGVPMNSGMTSNSSNGTYESDDAPIDYGNGAGDINPDDIESISVLKGPGATALYGSRAANGAIIITTKSGRKQKGLGITVTKGMTWDHPGYWPDFQYEYGAGSYLKSTLAEHMSNGYSPDEYSFYSVSADKSDTGKKVSSFHSRYQFGEKIEGQMRYMWRSYNRETGEFTRLPYEVLDWYKGFFQTGLTDNTALTVDASDGKGSSLRVSLKNTDSKWIVPNTGYTTQSFNVSASSKRNKYVEARLKMTYYRKDSDNLPISGYSDVSPLKTLLWQPVSASVADMYEEWSEGLITEYNSSPDGVPYKLTDANMDNPYFTAYEALNTMDRDRVYGNISLTGHIIPDILSLTVRSGMDFQHDFRTQRKPQYSRAYQFGMYKEQTITKMEYNLDFLLQFDKSWGDFRLNASFGGNMMHSLDRSVKLHAKALVMPNVFNVKNVQGEISYDAPRYEKSINSLYGYVSTSWKDMLFLEVTGRNDWSSTLAPGNWSYFYPSVNVSVLLDQVLALHDRTTAVDMLKVYGTWANVGNDTSPYSLLPTYTNSSNFTGSYYIPSKTLNYYIRPENIESWEAGIETSFFKRRIAFNATYYFSKTTDQIIDVPTDWASGASSTRINAGRVDNRGIELTATFMPIAARHFSWTIDVNWARNWNKLVELAEGVNLWQLNDNNTVGSRAFVYAYPGGELGHVWGRGYERAPKGAYYYDENGEKVLCEGEVLVNPNTGNPILTTGTQDLGSIYPLWNGGLQSTLRYRNLSLSASLAASYGGVAYSLTNAILAYMGKTTASLPGRYDGLVHPGVNRLPDGTYQKNSTITTDVVEYYNLYVCTRDNVESNTFDTSYLKLKEVRLDYSLPKKWLQKTKVLQSVAVGCYGTNLFCWTNWPQFDPEVASLAGGSLYKGVETGSYPMSRGFGFNLKVGF